MKYLYVAIISLAFLSPAYATMPVLTEQPASPNQALCEKWAVEQDEDAIEMWGTQNDGMSSSAVGLNRLAAFCMGQKPPDIIYFYSGSGFASAFCKKHASLKICKR